MRFLKPKRVVYFTLLQCDVGLIIPIITFLVGGLALLSLPEFNYQLTTEQSEIVIDAWLKANTRLGLAQWAILLMVCGMVGVWKSVLPRAVSFFALFLFYINVIAFALQGHNLLFVAFMQAWGLMAALVITLMFWAFRITHAEYTRAEMENRRLRTNIREEEDVESLIASDS